MKIAFPSNINDKKLKFVKYFRYTVLAINNILYPIINAIVDINIYSNRIIITTSLLLCPSEYNTANSLFLFLIYPLFKNRIMIPNIVAIKMIIPIFINTVWIYVSRNSPFLNSYCDINLKFGNKSFSFFVTFITSFDVLQVIIISFNPVPNASKYVS